MIELITKETDGHVKVRVAKDEAALEDVLGFMESEFYAGHCLYAAVRVDGEIYAELEM